MVLSAVHSWVLSRVGKKILSLDLLKEYQLNKIADTLDQAKSGTYYRERLKNCVVESFADLKKLPFTTSNDIIKNPYDFLCTPQSQVARIITLSTSGTSGRPKRIFFTEQDQHFCQEFFYHGMSDIINKGDSVNIFLGPESIGGTVNLLSLALKSLEAEVFINDFYKDSLQNIVKTQCLIGLPVNMLQLARAKPHLAPTKVLLCSDYAPKSIVLALKNIWNCEIFHHYGSTESGLGGAVECPQHDGFHIRDADLYFEVIDPVSLEPLPNGCLGELVFTTLNREAMPLIRYRTGDIAAIIDKACACGSTFPRLERFSGRFNNILKMATGETISIHQLDEVIFAYDLINDYQAILVDNQNLVLNVDSIGQFNPKKFKEYICDKLNIKLNIEIQFNYQPQFSSTVKRQIYIK